MCERTKGSLAAVEVESVVSEFASGPLKDPEEIEAGMDKLIHVELAARGGDPEQEARAWTRKIAGYDRLRAAYQDQLAAGYMTLDERSAKLEELEGARKLARAESTNLQTRAERVEEPE